MSDFSYPIYAVSPSLDSSSSSSSSPRPEVRYLCLCLCLVFFSSIAYSSYALTSATTLIVGIGGASLCIKIASCQTVSYRVCPRPSSTVRFSSILRWASESCSFKCPFNSSSNGILENVGCYPSTYNVHPCPPRLPLPARPIPIRLIPLPRLHRHPPHPTRYRARLPRTFPSRPTVSPSPIALWVSWADADTHADFCVIGRYSGAQVTVELSHWAGVVCAVSFFGFAAEARKNYRLAFWVSPLPPTARHPSPASASHGASPGQPQQRRQVTPHLTSLPLTPVKQRPDSDSLFGANTDAQVSMPMEKGRGCEYTLPSLSSSSSVPPHYGAHDIEAGAYVAHAYPSPAPSSSYATDNMDADAAPSPSVWRLTADVEQRPRPTTWPSLHSPRLRPHTAS
ncbi:hypothetical protein DFH08DRAFT_969047 [Mycena albidolilacea]|uniref:Uncharacterized protein n=1 Tax=Mycena albidolilacea TaxID=1033008 RepID=A0AAD7EI38_9AGAR|nr:hypothetical protein DFH08DRAFT_969047 [Mycena albidolilacea]